MTATSLPHSPAATTPAQAALPDVFTDHAGGQIELVRAEVADVVDRVAQYLEQARERAAADAQGALAETGVPHGVRFTGVRDDAMWRLKRDGGRPELTARQLDLALWGVMKRRGRGWTTDSMAAATLREVRARAFNASGLRSLRKKPAHPQWFDVFDSRTGEELVPRRGRFRDFVAALWLAFEFRRFGIFDSRVNLASFFAVHPRTITAWARKGIALGLVRVIETHRPLDGKAGSERAENLYRLGPVLQAFAGAACETRAPGHTAPPRAACRMAAQLRRGARAAAWQDAGARWRQDVARTERVQDPRQANQDRSGAAEVPSEAGRSPSGAPLPDDVAAPASGGVGCGEVSAGPGPLARPSQWGGKNSRAHRPPLRGRARGGPGPAETSPHPTPPEAGAATSSGSGAPLGLRPAAPPTAAACDSPADAEVSPSVAAAPTEMHLPRRPKPATRRPVTTRSQQDDPIRRAELDTTDPIAGDPIAGDPLERFMATLATSEHADDRARAIAAKELARRIAARMPPPCGACRGAGCDACEGSGRELVAPLPARGKKRKRGNCSGCGGGGLLPGLDPCEACGGAGNVADEGDT